MKLKILSPVWRKSSFAFTYVFVNCDVSGIIWLSHACCIRKTGNLVSVTKWLNNKTSFHQTHASIGHILRRHYDIFLFYFLEKGTFLMKTWTTDNFYQSFPALQIAIWFSDPTKYRRVMSSHVFSHRGKKKPRSGLGPYSRGSSGFRPLLPPPKCLHFFFTYFL